MEQQKIRKTFSERQVNVEMEWGDIGIKKNKKNIGGADSRQNWPIHHKKNEETPVHVSQNPMSPFFWKYRILHFMFGVDLSSFFGYPEVNFNQKIENMKEKKLTSASADVPRILKRASKGRVYSLAQMSVMAISIMREAGNCEIVLPGMGLV